MNQTLEDLLEQSRKAGTVESVGRFTVDFETAVRKLRERQVENQFHYIHRLIRAAVILKAPQVEIQCAHHRVRVHFPKAAAPINHLDKLASLILDGENLSQRELATAVNLVLGLEPQSLELKLSDGTHSRVLSIQNGQAEVFNTEPCPEGTTFQLTRNPDSKLSSWLADPPEYLNIFRRFRYAPITMVLNGKTLKKSSCWGEKSGSVIRIGGFLGVFSQVLYSNQHAIELRMRAGDLRNGIELGASLAHSQLDVRPTGQHIDSDNPMCSLAVGFCADHSKRSSASFVHWGETLQVFPVDLNLPAVEFLIAANDLDLDLSGERIIENDAFEQRWQEAKSCYELVEEALLKAYPQGVYRSLVQTALKDTKQRWRFSVPTIL